MIYETKNGTNELIRWMLEQKGFKNHRVTDEIVQSLSGISINAYLEALVADSDWDEVNMVLSMMNPKVKQEKEDD